MQIGCDRSSKLCSICQSRGHESLICDCLSLPFRTAAFDAVLCIAIVHHLSTEVILVVSLIDYNSDSHSYRFSASAVWNSFITKLGMLMPYTLHLSTLKIRLVSLLWCLF